MGTTIGTEAARLSDSPLGERLVGDACSFEFFQAVALLQKLNVALRPVGGFSSPRDEAVRFHVNSRLAFPASEIQQIDAPEDAQPEMTVNFMGLTGPIGVLPFTYSELILDRVRARDHSLAAFFDIFNHRAISLFYRAWQKPRFPVTYSAESENQFTRYLLDLIGLGTAGLRDRQDIEDEALLHYVALIAMQSRSAMALEQIIADYFEVPVDVQQFTGAWYNLDQRTQCAMKDDESASCQIGGGAVVGDAVWDRQARARIRLGPLGIDRYCDFLPGNPGFTLLRAVTRFFSSDCLDFELQLVLARDDVPSVELDLESPNAARLGWLSWAKTAPPGTDPDETILTL